MDDELHFGAHHGPLPMSLESVPISREAGSLAAPCIGQDSRCMFMTCVPPKATNSRMAASLAREHGHRTILSVPLLREGESIGAIVLRRLEVHPFSEKQIDLLQTFADQAVIAIGNVRLFDEVQAKTRDLTESLQQQTATADVLKVISRSAFDLEAVLEHARPIRRYSFRSATPEPSSRNAANCTI